MKKIILKEIHLSEWKAKNLSVKFNPEITNISGRNEIGKSSLLHAFTWALTGFTTATASKNEEIFDNRVPVSPDTPPASVKVVLTINDIEYTIERTAIAKFKHPRGRVEWVKESSDQYIIKIDNVEYSATNYEVWVENVICPIKHLPFLIDGAFFSALTIVSTQKARDVLSSIVGDIDIEGFEDVKEALQEYSIDKYKALVLSNIKAIKAKIDSIPTTLKIVEQIEKEWRDAHNKENAIHLFNEAALIISNEGVCSACGDIAALDAFALASRSIGVFDFLEELKSKLNTAMTQRKELAAGLVRCEGVKQRIDEYIEAKAEACANSINRRLEGANVEMFSLQKNGEKTPDCMLTDSNGVHYATLSTSARLRVNIAVQNFFREHYKVDMITWIDEAAVFDNKSLPRPLGQVCYLYAGDSETLKIK